ncbi:hypothetical protein SEUCBS139899_007954 [Sporothrix eucalyptigena]
MASPEPERPPKPSLASSTSDRNSKLSALLESIDADLGFTKKTPAAASDESGVNSFRRAKFFFPKLLEEQRKAAEAEKEAAAKRAAKGKGVARDSARDTKPADLSSASPDARSDHEPKRRKVSHEKPSRGSTPDRSPLSSPSSGRRNGRQGRDVRSVSRSESGSPPPRSRADKGKGRATAHSVNANVVFTRSPPDSKRQRAPSSSATIRRTTRSNKDDSVVVIDSNSDSDSDSELDLKPYQPRDKRNNDYDTKDKDDDDDLEIIDAEFAEYILKAKKARAQRADVDSAGDTNGAAAAVSTTVPASQATTVSLARSGSSFTLSGETPTSALTTTSASQPTAVASPPTAPPAASQPAPGDQQYRIFITSHFPQEVPPLLAYVRMDQLMRHVKDAYIGHANRNGVDLTDEQAHTVLLTWKGSKIYNSTTGLSLGIKPDAKGRFRDVHGPGSGGDINAAGAGAGSAGFMSGGLHLEIWTLDLYDAYLEAEDKRRRRNLGEAVEDDMLSDSDQGSGNQSQARGMSQGAGDTADATAPAAQTTRIRLVLKSRDYEKLKITAHNNTTIETLATAFRLQRGIGPDEKVAIMWDGEELDGGMTVGEAEMEDMDSVEVHIR